MAVILIIDDHEEWAEPLKKMRAMRQHTIEIRTNGRVALDDLERLRPDLIVLDLMMPVLDGVSFLQLLRGKPQWRALPVVVFTGYPDAISPAKRQELGVNEVLVKGSGDHLRLVERLRGLSPNAGAGTN